MPVNWENTKDFEDLILVLTTFSKSIGEVLNEIVKIFTRVFRGLVWNIEGVQHAAIFDRFSEGVNTVLVRGCQWEGQHYLDE